MAATDRYRQLTDAQWARIEPLLPSSDGRRGRPFRNSRQILEGVIYRYRTGIPWRDLPEHFGPWQTVWKRHRRYTVDGTWDRILQSLLADADAAGLISWIVSVDAGPDPRVVDTLTPAMSRGRKVVFHHAPEDLLGAVQA
jgi:transposase